MTTNNFRTIARALRDHVEGTYALLDAADAVERILPDLTGTPVTSMSYTHDAIVDKALRSRVAMQHMRDGKKINAIKEVRMISSCGLKEAKDAVEDERVIIATGYTHFVPSTSWGSDYDRDEPPF